MRQAYDPEEQERKATKHKFMVQSTAVKDPPQGDAMEKLVGFVTWYGVLLLLSFCHYFIIKINFIFININLVLVNIIEYVYNHYSFNPGSFLMRQF